MNEWEIGDEVEWGVKRSDKGYFYEIRVIFLIMEEKSKTEKILCKMATFAIIIIQKK